MSGRVPLNRLTAVAAAIIYISALAAGAAVGQGVHRDDQTWVPDKDQWPDPPPPVVARFPTDA